jgi:hypothetical protein
MTLFSGRSEAEEALTGKFFFLHFSDDGRRDNAADGQSWRWAAFHA